MKAVFITFDGAVRLSEVEEKREYHVGIVPRLTRPGTYKPEEEVKIYQRRYVLIGKVTDHETGEDIAIYCEKTP